MVEYRREADSTMPPSAFNPSASCGAGVKLQGIDIKTCLAHADGMAPCGRAFQAHAKKIVGGLGGFTSNNHHVADRLKDDRLGLETRHRNPASTAVRT